MRDERSLYAGARLLAPWGNSAVAMFGFRVPHTRPLVGATANIFYTTTQWGTVVAQTQVRPIRNYARLFHSYLNQLKASTPSSRAPDPYDADMSMDISADVSMQGGESIDVFEECGFFQWVPNTSPLRPVLMKGYEARRIKSWSEMNDTFWRIKDSSDKDATEMFQKKIGPSFPPVLTSPPRAVHVVYKPASVWVAQRSALAEED
ncbi:hypothetical protein C8F04DRAFT_1297009 [Mycena alexandri]|uniref:Uncharacterized protein n=1 Tax=Mycena alexandri TaxID=1745969 RepID=A0AAD6X7H1_9AGAR|nr:hypothetical protein C8F04DRAFT_1297009 [Mycena alexandri]